MIIKVWTRDDETGILDGENRDGDIAQTYLDSFEPSLGNLEKRTSLFIKVPDPPNIQKFRDELIAPEYLPAASPESTPTVKHKTKYRINWRTKFTAQEIALIESVADTLPDGHTNQGGNVTAGVVDSLFTVNDIIRK